MKKDEIPQRESCDVDDPEEMFWWMFVSMPGLKGALAMVPLEYYRLMSKRLHDLGARLKCDACGHMAKPTLKLRLPQTEEHWMTGLGKWVPIDEPDPPRTEEAKEIVRKLPKELRDQLTDALDAVEAESIANPHPPTLQEET
ncbi:phage gene 29 protein family protein [Rhodococcus sp. no. 34]